MSSIWKASGLKSKKKSKQLLLALLLIVTANRQPSYSMPIKTTFSGASETIRGFEAVAEEKLESGFVLMSAGSHGDGAYMTGYAAELLLKCACLRLYDYDVNHPILMANFSSIKRDAVNNLGVPVPSEQYHDLTFWSEIAIRKRASNGLVVNVQFDDELRSRTVALADQWWVGMRYQPIGVVDHRDLYEVLDHVMWVHSNYQKIWS